MPTYNRARFLHDAFESISAQTFTDWELIVVDDGSTDNTRELVNKLSATVAQPVRFIYQANQGPAGARNAGLAVALSEYVAFLDSDDCWLPHHLHDCIQSLDANPDVDWVYGADRRVDHATGRVLTENSFRQADRLYPCMNIHTRLSGRLHIIDDPRAVCCAILHDYYCGFQKSVFRSRVFSRLRIPPYRVGEDQAFVVLAMKEGYRLGYLDDVHLEYHVHDGNLSATTLSGAVDKKVDGFRELIRAFEELPTRVVLNGDERRALRKRLSRDYFWHLGYGLLWQHGRRQEALETYRRAIRLWPWSLACWKTYLLAALRTRLGKAADQDKVEGMLGRSVPENVDHGTLRK